MNKFFYTTVLILLLSSLQACKDEYTLCNLPKDVRFSASFYKKVNGNDVAAAAPNLSITQIGSNAALYAVTPNVSTFSIPFNPLLDSSKYIFKLSANLPQDTVTFVYTSVGVNISPECGSTVFHTLTKITTTINTLDSVKIIQPLVNTDPLQNARFYF